MDIALAKDRSSSGILSSKIVSGKVEEKSINRDSSSVLVFTEEDMIAKLSHSRPREPW